MQRPGREAILVCNASAADDGRFACVEVIQRTLSRETATMDAGQCRGRAYAKQVAVRVT